MKIIEKNLKTIFLKKFRNFNNNGTLTDFIWMYHPHFTGQVFWNVPHELKNTFQLEIKMFDAFNSNRNSIKFHNILPSPYQEKFFLHIITRF